MYWQEEYRRKLVSAEEAVRVVKSGDRIAIPRSPETPLLGFALAQRKDELRDVEIAVCGPQTDFGWFQPGWEKSFVVKVDGVGYAARAALDEKRADFAPICPTTRFKALDDGRPESKAADVATVAVSPPDKNGFCSFGNVMSNQKSFAKRAKKVLAEVNSNFIRTYGDNFMHVSEIEAFVENTRPIEEVFPVINPEPDEHAKEIAGYVATLIRDGDTIQLGVGTAASWMPAFGVFDNRQDLGLHAGAARSEEVRLVRDGVITGKHKTLHSGKAVSASFGCYGDDLSFIDSNPMFELYDMQYINDIRIIAANDNMVTINQAVSIDLTGQITADSLGTRIFGGGSLVDLVMGSILSKGGRSIIAVPSTASRGKVSRIVPMFELGTIVTVPRVFADYVVTEYGIARLMGKSQRERAQELIAIAHPDFRPELKKEAQRLYWP